VIERAHEIPRSKRRRRAWEIRWIENNTGGIRDTVRPPPWCFSQGDVEPISTESSTPRGKELVRASGGDNGEAVVVRAAIRIDGDSNRGGVHADRNRAQCCWRRGRRRGNRGKSKPRLISDTVFCCVFATSAAPVPFVMATPIGRCPW